MYVCRCLCINRPRLGVLVFVFILMCVCVSSVVCLLCVFVCKNVTSRSPI